MQRENVDIYFVSFVRNEKFRISFNYANLNGKAKGTKIEIMYVCIGYRIDDFLFSFFLSFFLFRSFFFFSFFRFFFNKTKIIGIFSDVPSMRLTLNENKCCFTQSVFIHPQCIYVLIYACRRARVSIYVFMYVVCCTSGRISVRQAAGSLAATGI